MPEGVAGGRFPGCVGPLLMCVCVPGRDGYPRRPQVCSYDFYDRFRVLGYTSLSLADSVPGSRTHLLSSWAPLGTVSQRMRSFFVGGAPGLPDVTYLRKPAGAAYPLSKFGFQTQTSGTLKVRVNSLVHSRNRAKTPLAIEQVAMAKRQAIKARFLLGFASICRLSPRFPPALPPSDCTIFVHASADAAPLF